MTRPLPLLAIFGGCVLSSLSWLPSSALLPVSTLSTMDKAWVHSSWVSRSRHRVHHQDRTQAVKGPRQLQSTDGASLKSGMVMASEQDPARPQGINGEVFEETHLETGPQIPDKNVNVVLTHVTADFDSLAAAVGLAKLWKDE
ncbi:unnamed protein product, partial [Choristocarpus tenellus]